MKYIITFSLFLVISFSLSAQDLHSDSNAVSVNNESDSENGWYGPANISSVTQNPFDGNFCFRIEMVASNQRDARYTFPANIGDEYEIRIYARTGTQNFKPAFANWQGVTGFSTTPIIGSNWTEYVFNVTATSTSPEIRIYVSPASGGQVGNHIFIDRASITSTSVQDSEAPDEVDDLNSSNVQITSLQLNWTEPNDNVGVSNYEVFQDNQSIGTTNNTNFTVNSGLSPNTEYDFNVVAIDAANNRSGFSNTETVTTQQDGNPPNAVSDLNSNSLTFNSVNLFWSDPGDNIGVTDYEVFQENVSLGLTGGANSLNVSGLSPNSSYNFTVIAIDAADNRSASSNILTVNTPSAPDSQAPDPVNDLGSSSTTFTSTRLSWSTPFDNEGVTQFEVFQDNVLIASTNANFLVVNDLTPGTEYTFHVVALDAALNRSPNSNSEILTTQTDTENPSVITNLSETNITMNSVDLSWSPASDNVGVTGYDIFRNSALLVSDHLTTTYTDNTLQADTPYTYYVVAKDAAGNTSESNQVNFRTLDALNYDSSNANLSTVDWLSRDLFASRNLGIGTQNTQGYRLAVAGNVVAEEIKVALETDWPDYVFEKDYRLPSLEEVEEFILVHGHLRNIPDKNQVDKEGIYLGEMNALLLEKIEELTLYIIEQDKRIKKLESELVKEENVD